MRWDFARIHLDHMNRRDALRMGAAGAAAAAVAAGGGHAASAAPEDTTAAPESSRRRPSPSDHYDDEMFDVQAVVDGAWVPSPYGAGDQRGAFNELTPDRTSDALRLLNRGKPVNTYQLGESKFNGFPAYPSDPPRLHEMHLLASGYQPPEGFEEGGGIISDPAPSGPNRLSGNEERFSEFFTYQCGTQLDGLGHVGVDGVFYNGFRGSDIATPVGLAALGNETMGPLVARAVIYDVVGLKVAQGATADFFIAPNGQPVLRDNYRITIDDLEACRFRQRIRRDITPGDVPIIHTGWTHLVRDDPERYLAQEPGIFLAEVRYFADRKPVFIGSDVWGLECLDPEVTQGNVFPCHQELLGKYGIRIGESFVTDAAIADDVYEGVVLVTPENVPGATCGSSAPALLGQPGPPPRD